LAAGKVSHASAFNRSCQFAASHLDLAAQEDARLIAILESAAPRFVGDEAQRLAASRQHRVAAPRARD
jgi:hypothetical protein